MKSHGLLLSAPMVLAALARRKTQTRRVVTPRNSLIDGVSANTKAGRALWTELDWSYRKFYSDVGHSPAGLPGPYIKVPHKTNGNVHRVYPIYQPGDEVWFKETWEPVMTRGDRALIKYRADNATKEVALTGAVNLDRPGWRCSMFMPRWACRLKYTLTRVGAQRVQAISEADAKAEGTDPLWYSAPHDYLGEYESARQAFRDLWNRINAKRGLGWSTDPPVWVLDWGQGARQE